MIRGRSSSDRLQKTKFFFVLGNWAGDPIDVNRTPFPPFTSALGRLRPEGMFSLKLLRLFICSFPRLTILLIHAAVTHPHLDDYRKSS